MIDAQSLEILEVLKSLPPEKVAEVMDFAIFLRERYERGEMLALGEMIIEGETVDESDYWTDEDLMDVTRSSILYAEEIYA